MNYDDDPDSGTSPECLAVCLFAALAFGVVLAFTSPKRPPPEPPSWPVFGCYRTSDGPDILIDAKKVVVLQTPQIETASTLKYNKGWAFETEHWLDLNPSPGNRFLIDLNSPHGEFLSLTKEGEISAGVAGFTLYSISADFSVRYLWIEPTCG